MKHLICGVLVALAAQAAHARMKYGMAGCGLGAVAFEDENALFAATTNSSSFQSFAISSGTSNCDVDRRFAAVQAQRRFFAENMKDLSKEMAQGDGQYTRAFASTLGCSEKSYAAFGRQMQASYADIFAQPGADAALLRIRSVVSEHPELGAACVDVAI